MNVSLEDSVVLITSLDPNKKDVIGTGFVIYREEQTTYLVTCAHVVEDVGGEDKVQIYEKPAKVFATSDVKDFDLAVLTIDYPKSPVLKLENSGKEGTKIKTAGYYLYSSERKRSLEEIEGILGRQKFRVNQDTGDRATVWEVHINDQEQLQKGYSGSPVVALENGCVIGVVTNMDRGGQTGEIISIEALANVCTSVEVIDAHSANRLIKISFLPVFHDAIVNFLIKKLNHSLANLDSDPTERYWIYIALGKIGGNQAKSVVTEGLSDENLFANSGAEKAFNRLIKYKI